MELKDRVAVVAGGSGDLGVAICMRLAREGARVALTYRSDRKEAEQIVDAIESISGTAWAETVDILDYEAVSEFVKTVVAKWGRLDILVNAVGARDRAKLFDMTKTQFDHIVDVNLKGAFHYIRAAASIFREQKSGKVVNVSSLSAMGGAGDVNDAAAKSGILGLTMAAARELGPFNVNVNAVAPGLVETAALARESPEVVEKAITRSVLGRLAKPEEVADVVLFLCGPRSRHITGEVIRVDGGQHL